MITAQQIKVYSGVKLNVEVELDRLTMSVRELLDLRTGAVIPLTKALGENLSLRVGGRDVGEGEIVLLEQRMGLRIARLHSTDSRQTGKRA